MFAVDAALGAHQPAFQRASRGDDLERRARLDNVHDRPVFARLNRHPVALVEVVVRAVGHCQHLPRRRPHDDAGGHLGPELLHGRVHLAFHDVLERHVHGEAHRCAVTRGAFHPPEGHHLVSTPVAFRITETVMALEPVVHRTLHAFHPLVLAIHIADHVGKHAPVGVDPHRVLLEKHSPDLLVVQLRCQGLGHVLSHLVLDDNVATWLFLPRIG